jgi:hypothetical protein
MENKTKLWDSVFKTDPSSTKAFSRAGGFSGTAIKPLYLIHKATALWGPMGDAWGAETAEHIISGNTVFIKARLWYPGASNKAWVEHWGGDVLIKETKNGVRANDEAFKMAFTDAIGKCLVQLGFSADVHLGMFDDNKYVDERRKEENGSAKDIYGTHGAMKGKFTEIKESIESAETHEQLKSIWKENNTHILAMKKLDETFYGDLETAKEKQKKIITEKQANVAAYGEGFIGAENGF